MQTSKWVSERQRIAKWAFDIREDTQGVRLIDTETSGRESRDEVCQIAIVELRGTEINVLLEALVKPVKILISDGASQVTGITNDTVRYAPFIHAYRVAIEHLLDGRRCLAYNADFDERLLRQSFNAVHFPFPFEFEDVMRPYARFYGESGASAGGFKPQKLVNACKQQNIPVVDAHRAAADCIMTAKLILKMAEAYDAGTK